MKEKIQERLEQREAEIHTSVQILNQLRQHIQNAQEGINTETEKLNQLLGSRNELYDLLYADEEEAAEETVVATDGLAEIEMTKTEEGNFVVTDARYFGRAETEEVNDVVLAEEDTPTEG